MKIEFHTDTDTDFQSQTNNIPMPIPILFILPIYTDIDFDTFLKVQFLVYINPTLVKLTISLAHLRESFVTMTEKLPYHFFKKMVN